MNVPTSVTLLKEAREETFATAGERRAEAQKKIIETIHAHCTLLAFLEGEGNAHAHVPRPLHPTCPLVGRLHEPRSPARANHQVLVTSCVQK